MKIDVPSKSNKKKNFEKTTVADPGCLSRIPDPDFYPSRIPDLGSKDSNERHW
jgi:hypothetical protein